ncbi:STAS domain-containing protein [Uliginosibacterium sp. 31-16]|uniref:STAS domain-containing protein n=1 Tax=Uliginosibacterium sp. 31-16 TaxID=3068315 RepID=UPI00273D4851|nr:STAS domain-containing protein [Uliginosibacterium sp. 31-16]MDP5237899.1 STAS domain-containing protein [Uliginosibacterium sp. 31-16]
MISERDGQLFVSGTMNQQTAAALLLEGEPWVSAADRVINLGGIEAVDSSALAVVLGWMRAARSAGKTLQIADAPTAFVSLASLYGVTPLLFPEAGNAASAEH